MELIDELKTISTIVSITSPIISILSLYFTSRFWFATNRPIVCAKIVTHSSGNLLELYNLIIHNSGNRPATNIRLYADKNDIENIIFKDGKNHEMWKNSIDKCFSEEGIIQLLLNGESITNAFGHTGQEGVLIYNSSLKIKIEYEDIEKTPYKRRYTSYQMLLIKSSKDFAGTFFQ